MTWPYDLYICDCGYGQPEDHDGSCGAWRHGGTWHDYGYRQAFEAAAREGHAYVESTSPHNGRKAVVFQHVQGGGLCELCGPATGRRGPYTRSPNGRRFLCDPCVRDLQGALDDLHKSSGAYRTRELWPVLEDSDR
ncbi:hypothetical protein [Streptomyces sp. TBY4]|uniref:hypothetical protein n=1 Tax=Streptomyces sp. TBY4 TaxID=2962030 RepID=UPI0020B72C38|nr:hypothetical protein [Streptomyces sp. TBY4]MCP3755777.1 hypothetical protein [Streptomyces sp. TBY4]